MLTEIMIVMRTILFIDDEKLTCKYFIRALSKYFTITACYNLQDAQDAISANRPYDIIISDYKLSNTPLAKTGLDFLNDYLKENGSATDLYLCSSYNIKGFKVENGISYLLKPIDSKLLKETL
jgi:CheY-like chemotaxis protein